jgi:undecaprenyl-diphosphatase
MLRHAIQTFVWKYDLHFTSAVALLPTHLQPYSSKLGRMTLPVIWAGAIALICASLVLINEKQLALLGIAVIVCIPVGTLHKLIDRRERPKTIYARNMKIKSYSFPSSHTYSATIAGGYIILLGLSVFPPIIGLITGSLLTILIVCIGISRVHIGAHYPTDVTAGWVMGVAVLYFATNLAL